MHNVVVVDDHGRKFAQRFGGIGMNVLPNDHPLMGAFIIDFAALDILHAAHKLKHVGIEVGMPGLKNTNCALGGSRSCRDLLCSALMSTRAILASARSLSKIAGTWGICRRALGAHARRRHKARDAVNDRIIYNPRRGRARRDRDFFFDCGPTWHGAVGHGSARIGQGPCSRSAPTGKISERDRPDDWGRAASHAVLRPSRWGRRAE
jgi:hypothetical protein